MTENNTVNSPGQTTRTDPRNANETALDLILASPILSRLQIDTGPSIGSDHVTVIIRNKTTKKIPSIKRKKEWKIRKFTNEGWLHYQRELSKLDKKIKK